MKRVLTLVVVFCFSFVSFVNAACDYKETAELNQDASAIKITYDEAVEYFYTKDGSGRVEENYFKISIMNLTNKFYIIEKENKSNNENIIKYSTYNDGIATMDWKDLSKVTTLTFNVYASNLTGCKDKLIRTIYVTLPRYNSYYALEACSNISSSLCDKYVMSEEIDYFDFLTRLSEVEKTQSEKEDSDDTNVKLNMGIIIGISAGVIILITAVVIIVRRKKEVL